MQNWHAKNKKEIFHELKTSEKGLTKNQAEKKLEEFGPNELSKKRKSPAIFILLKQFNSPLIYILFVAMIISFIFNHIVDAYVILGVVLLDAIIGFVQERRAERAIDALKKMVVAHAKVYRDEKLIQIAAEKLVPGDIIEVEEGDRVPADARLISIKNFRTQEASLTGESFPTDKNLDVLSEKTHLADRENLIFMGTMVVSGTAKAVVVGTAKDTAIGKVAQSIQEVAQPKMHFQKKTTQLAIHMALFAGIGSVLIFLIGFFINKLEFIDIFMFTIASLVSGIPEGLPAVLIIVLAIGARRMAKKNAIVRHLPAVESLGVITVIATDKTGTLTQNSMAVEKIYTSEKQEVSITGNGWQPIGKFISNKIPFNPNKNKLLKKILEISSLSNKGALIRDEDKYEIVGDPTEVALLVLAKKAGIEKTELSKEKKILDDFSFKSELKFRASLIGDKRQKEIYSIGAFESILDKSSYYLSQGKKVKLEEKLKKHLLNKATEYARNGLRVLGLAYRPMPFHTKTVSKDDVTNLVFVGLVGMKDPPRMGVKESIAKAKKAGIRIIMKTGDHKETAIAIAKEVGLSEGNYKALTETELDNLSDESFTEAVKTTNVFARVTPTMKMRLVKELQSQGEIVAMTGDGVNDAPALKASDIGISMGKIGTDVARESSEIVLADDHFSSIVSAIEEGRTVFRNVRRTSFFLVSTNVAEHLTIISSLAMGLPLPMLPTQLLYLNLVTDGVTDIGLAMEKSHPDVLTKPPRDKNENILNKSLMPFLLLSSILMVGATIPLFKFYLVEGIDKARTIAFTTMSMFQFFNLFNMRSLKNSLFKIGVFSNKYLWWAVIASFSAMLAVLYVPVISTIFHFVPLTLKEFALITLITSSVFFLGEMYKLGLRRFGKSKKIK